MKPFRILDLPLVNKDFRGFYSLLTWSLKTLKFSSSGRDIAPVTFFCKRIKRSFLLCRLRILWVCYDYSLNQILRNLWREKKEMRKREYTRQDSRQDQETSISFSSWSASSCLIESASFQNSAESNAFRSFNIFTFEFAILTFCAKKKRLTPNFRTNSPAQ